MQTYKAYSIVHPFLSSIQKGIQTAHAVADLNHESKAYVAWMKSPTLIVLDGSADLETGALRIVMEGADWHNWTVFREPMLSHMMTAVIVLVPDDANLDAADERDGARKLREWLATRKLAI